MQGYMRNIIASVGLVALGACSWGRGELGGTSNEGGFGLPTQGNVLLETGQRPYAIQLDKRFSSEVPNTVNFAFNRHDLDEGDRAVLRKQANWIKRFPEVRFRVFGYTDLVGSEHYNKTLGMRRARTVVNYLVSLGVARSRLQAVVSYGETRPLIRTQAPERANRRAVTDVSGFVQSAPLVLDGKYAEVIFRSYVASGVPTQDSSTGQGGASAGTMGGG